VQKKKITLVSKRHLQSYSPNEHAKEKIKIKIKKRRNFLMEPDLWNFLCIFAN
jgi:hypothetical protein